MEREVFFCGGSIFIPSTHEIREVIMVSQTRKLAREGNCLARTVSWVSSGSWQKLDLSLRRNKRSPLRVEDLLDLQSSHSSKEGASKRWGGGGGGDEGPFLLQAHELQLGSAAFSHAAQAWLRGLAPHCGRIRALAFCWWDQPGLSPASLQGEPGHLTPLRKSVACNALIYLETTLLSKKKKQKNQKQGRPRKRNKKKHARARGLRTAPTSVALMVRPHARHQTEPSHPPPVPEEAWPSRAAILGASLGALFTTLWPLAPAPPLPSHCLEEQPRPQRLLFISPQCPDVNGLQCIFQGNLLLSM